MWPRLDSWGIHTAPPQHLNSTRADFHPRQAFTEEDRGEPGLHINREVGREELLDVVFIQLTVHSTDAHVLHHLNTTESHNTSA